MASLAPVKLYAVSNVTQIKKAIAYYQCVFNPFYLVFLKDFTFLCKTLVPGTLYIYRGFTYKLVTTH